MENKTGDAENKITEDELRLAKVVIQEFLQTLKSFQLYETNHPILLRFLDRLKQSFDNYLKKYDSFTIQVDELHFLFKGNVVYENRDLRESLAFMFFKDGIREIRFFNGLDLNEIVDFLNTVRKGSVVNRMEDDLVTLLWNKEFLHIEFIVIDDFFEGEGTLVPLTEEDLIKGLEYRGFGDAMSKQYDEKVDTGNGNEAGSGTGLGGTGSGGGIGSGTGAGIDLGKGTGYGVGTKTGAGGGGGTGQGTGVGSETEKGLGKGTGAGVGLEKGADAGLTSGTATGESLSLVVEGLRQALDLPIDKSLIQICALMPDEIEEIYRKALKEEQLETLYSLIINFTEILLHLGEDTKTYENIVLYLDRIVKSLLEGGDVKRAVTILKNFSPERVATSLKEKQINVLKHILQIASDPHCIELLGKIIKRNNEADWEPINQYLQLLTQNAIDPLCLLLRDMEIDRWRKVVRERLSELCKEEIKPLMKFLSDSKVSFITDILYILGKIAHPFTLKYLTDLAYHEDFKVREEILRLSTLFKDKGKDIVQKFLTDPVPEIRGKAASIFAKLAREQAFKPLSEIILSEDFYTRTYDEKISFFKALGETGSKRAIPILKQIINKKKWFNRAQWEEMRICAANALKLMEVVKE